MQDYPALNFPGCRFRTDRRNGVVWVWDSLRSAWVVLTPEEWVRQHLVGLLIDHMGVASTAIRMEYPVDIQGMAQRADVVVANRRGEPMLIVECKAPTVPIDGGVYAQAARYNSVVGARFMMLTNGLKHYFYRADGAGGYEPLNDLPNLREMLKT